MTNRVCTTDPVSLHDIPNVAGHPWVDEGELRIYFETEENKQAYLGIPTEHPEYEMSKSLDNPTDYMTDEG